MLPDNIKQNIMKYLNNGVSGSSQQQKPQIVGSLIDFDIVAPAFTNIYADNEYMIDATRYTDNGVQKWGFMVFTIEKAIQGEFQAFYEIPNYNNQPPYIVTGTLNRDEDGRFYMIITFGTENNNAQYLVIFNDFITEGIIQINKAYNLNNINFNVNSSTTQKINQAQIDHVIKLNGKGEYLLYNSQYPSYITSTNVFKFFIIKLIIEYTGSITTKTYAYDITTESENAELRISNINFNVDSDNVYAMLSYNTTYSQSGTTITPTNFNVGIIELPSEDEAYNVVNIRRIYNNNSYIGVGDKDGNYLNNGIYVRDIIYTYSNNTLTLKYILVRADGTTQVINFPSTISITNFSGIGYSISNNFIILAIGGDTSIKSLYKLTNNSITYIQDIEFTFGVTRTYILQNFNLYYVFNLLLRPRAFIIRDVPVYGRDCLLKQKLLNSAIFRVIKKYRNRRTNI